MYWLPDFPNGSGLMDYSVLMINTKSLSNVTMQGDGIAVYSSNNIIIQDCILVLLKFNENRAKLQAGKHISHQ